MKKLFFSAALMMGLAAVSFAGTPDKASKVEASEATTQTADEPIYDLKESENGAVLFSGTESEILSYNNTNYSQCDGQGENCTWVYDQETEQRNTTLERKHD